MTPGAVDAASSKRAGGRRRQGEATRQRIIDAFIDLLDERPIWEITVTMLTRQFGVSSQLFYQHFSSLDDVLMAHCDVVLTSLPQIEELIEGDWPEEECFSRMREITDRALAFWECHRPVMRVLAMLDDVHDPRFKRFRELRGRDAAAAFARLVGRQIERGRLPATMSCDLAGWFCVSRLQGFGLAYRDLIATGHDGEIAKNSFAAMLAISLGFTIAEDAM